MKIKYYFNRIINNKVKLATMLLIFLYPIIDIVLLLKDVSMGASVLEPNLASFLSSRIFNFAQCLLLWFLPLYIILIVADDCIEDYKLGYRNVLVSKWGKRSYVITNIIKGFTFGFLVIFISLAINLVMTQIIFNGGNYIGLDTNTIEGIESLRHSLQCPLLTNIKYIVLASLLSGVVGLGASSVSLIFHDRFIVYPLVFVMWYIPNNAFIRPVMLAIQPFTEYSILDSSPALIFVFVINLVAALVACVKEIKYAKI